MELWMHSYCNHYLLLTKKDNWNLKFHSISLTFVPSPSLDGIFDGKLANDIRNNIMNFRINDFSAAQRYNFGITCWWVNLTCKINLKFIFLQVSIVGGGFRSKFWNFSCGHEWKWKQNITHCYFIQYEFHVCVSSSPSSIKHI